MVRVNNRAALMQSAHLFVRDADGGYQFNYRVAANPASHELYHLLGRYGVRSVGHLAHLADV